MSSRFLALLAAALAWCSHAFAAPLPPPAAALVDIVAGRWTVESIDGKSVHSEAISVRFEETKVAGHEDCHFFNGVYSGSPSLMIFELETTATASCINKKGEAVKDRDFQIFSRLSGRVELLERNRIRIVNKANAAMVLRRLASRR